MTLYETVDALQRILTPFIAAIPPNDCIGVSHLVRDVLRECGFRAEAIACVLAVSHPASKYRVVIGPQSLTLPAPNHPWPGHVVVLASDGEFVMLLDWTVAQANRPEHGITGLESFSIVVDDDEFRLEPGVTVLLRSPEDHELFYILWPNDRGFTATEAWGEGESPRAGIVNRTLATKVKKVCAGAPVG